MSKLGFSLLAAATGAEQAPHARELTEAPCPEGWCRLRNTCFWVSTEKATYAKAKTSCEAATDVGSAQLAKLNNMMENEFIMTLTGGVGSSRVWIGAKEKADVTGAAPVDNDNRYEWTDGSEIAWSNWREGQPKNTEVKSNGGDAFVDDECAYVGEQGTADAEWQDTVCSNEYRFACSVPAKAHIDESAGRCYDMEACPFPYHKFNTECLLVSSFGDTSSWTEATCPAGGALAIVRDAEQGAQIMSLAQGGDRTATPSTVWIGTWINRTEGFWKDCYPPYANWAKEYYTVGTQDEYGNDIKKFNGGPAGKSCVLMGKASFTDTAWHPTDCEGAHRYACSQPAKAAPGTQTSGAAYQSTGNSGMNVETYNAVPTGKCCVLDKPTCDGSQTSSAEGASLVPGLLAAAVASMLLQ